MKAPINYTIIRKSRSGYKFILEPQERAEYRNKCKYSELGCICKKGHYTYIKDGRDLAVLIGCTADVRCPRMKRWDTMHGIEKPYTMVEKEEDLQLLYGLRYKSKKN